MSYLSFETCVTHHGSTTTDLFEGLLDGATLQKKIEDKGYFSISSFGNSKTYLEKIEFWMDQQLSELKHIWDFKDQEKWGLVFASTKGIIEDLVWDDEIPKNDPYYPVLKSLEEKFPGKVEKSIIVSNACSSSHGAVEMAQRWLKRKQVDHVFVFAADLIGPFTLKGFSSLRALSENKSLKPFDKNRDGLLLGDGIASVVVSREPQKSSDLKISPVYTLCEGVSATRPDTTGVNLAHCFEKASLNQADVFLAHGTGTFYNDLTESKAIHRFYSSQTPPAISTSKWGVGHTLGVSGLIDLCLASEIFINQKVPGIGTLEESDLEVAEWLLKKPLEKNVKTVLISSLGFGGVCSALEISSEVSL